MAGQTNTAGVREDEAAAILRICSIEADAHISGKQVDTLLRELKLPTMASLNDRRQRLKEACNLVKETGRINAPAERLAAPTRLLRRSASLKATEPSTTSKTPLRRAASLDAQEPAGPTTETTETTAAQAPPTHTENTAPAAPAATEAQPAAPATQAAKTAGEPQSTGAAPETEPTTTEPPTHEAPNPEPETVVAPNPEPEAVVAPNPEPETVVAPKPEPETVEMTEEEWDTIKATALENARRPIADSSSNAASHVQIVITRILTSARAHTFPRRIMKRLVNYDDGWIDRTKSMTIGTADNHDTKPTAQPTGTNRQADASKANAEHQLAEAISESRYTTVRHATTVCAVCNASITRKTTHTLVPFKKDEWPSQQTGLATTTGTHCNSCASPHTTTVVALTPNKEGGIIILTGENLPSNLTWGPHTATLAAGLAKTVNKRQTGETWTAVIRDLDGRSETSSTSKTTVPRTTEKLVTAIYTVHKTSDTPRSTATTARAGAAQNDTRPTYATATKANITPTTRPTAAKMHTRTNPTTAKPTHHAHATHQQSPKTATKRRVCLTDLDMRWTAATLCTALQAEHVDMFDTFAIATMATASTAQDLTGGGKGTWHRFANGRRSYISYDRPWARKGKVAQEQASADRSQQRRSPQAHQPASARQHHPAQQPEINAQPKPSKPLQDDTKAAILTALAEVLPNALAALMAQHDALRATIQNGQLQQQAIQFTYPDLLGFPQQPLGAAPPAGLVAPTRS